MKKIVIIGGGASGMSAAFAASSAGAEVTLIEKNEKLGKKVFISGKGRCNLTNAADIGTILKNVVTNPKFLYSALYGFTNEDVMKLMEDNGCPVKTERGDRVFPVSDHSSDVIRAWEKVLKNNHAEIRLNTQCGGIKTEEDPYTGEKKVSGVRVFRTGRNPGMKETEFIPADAVILATGGLSYPLTGSTGDGHRFAAETGHRMTDELPALVPFETAETWVSELSGLSLKNIRITVKGRKGKYYEAFGEMMFTHFGVTGPVILSAASMTAKKLRDEERLMLFIDLKPALSEEELDARILRDFDSEKNKQFRNALDQLLPQKLIRRVILESGIDAYKKVNEISREERRKLVQTLKGLKLTVTGTRGFEEAIVTQGGVSVKDIQPGTMESRIVHGLYFAGELIDIDALTGGYNLQLAWSTGYLAGSSASEEKENGI